MKGKKSATMVASRMTQAGNPLADPATWNVMADDYLAEVTPHFENYAADALRLAAPTRNARIVDVACGPGTLSILAAPRVAEVFAIDFSTEMVERVRQRAQRAGNRNVTVQVGDGHALPWPDAHFDAGFSMFGVFLFDDRARGLAELRRVVRPGCQVVISSWVAAERAPLIKLVRKVMQRYIPGMPDVEQSPLGSADMIRAEVEPAGFRDLHIERVVHAQVFPSLDAAWLSMRRAIAPVVLLRDRMAADEYAVVETDIRDLLERELGSGAQSVEMPAWIVRGTV
jgi:ubiquinone/menaquinone biosynthesis C-methylase UbiE